MNWSHTPAVFIQWNGMAIGMEHWTHPKHTYSLSYLAKNAPKPLQRPS